MNPPVRELVRWLSFFRFCGCVSSTSKVWLLSSCLPFFRSSRKADAHGCDLATSHEGLFRKQYTCMPKTLSFRTDTHKGNESHVAVSVGSTSDFWKLQVNLTTDDKASNVLQPYFWALRTTDYSITTFANPTSCSTPSAGP